MEFITQSAEATQNIASQLAHFLEPGMVIRLDGPLGAGKTTFTQGLGQALGVTRRIKSPTYTIVKSYPIPQGILTHIDAYRLEGLGAESIDLASMIDNQSIVVVEWAEFIAEDLPEDILTIQFENLTNGGRRISFSASGSKRMQEIMNQMNAFYHE